MWLNRLLHHYQFILFNFSPIIHPIHWSVTYAGRVIIIPLVRRSILLLNLLLPLGFACLPAIGLVPLPIKHCVKDP